MLKYVARQLPDGWHAAGYFRPSDNTFVPVVAGCPSLKVAQEEADQLNLQSAAKTPPPLPNHMRAPSRGWYADAE